jgi:hypothetical protein
MGSEGRVGEGKEGRRKKSWSSWRGVTTMKRMAGNGNHSMRVTTREWDDD